MAANGKGGNQLRAHFIAILGVTGCGKTTRLSRRLEQGGRKRKRTIIYSPKEELDNYAALYPGSVVVTTLTEAKKVIKAAGKGEFHLVFKPRRNRASDTAMFSVLCKMAMAAGNLTFIVDELHTVTLPSWAPDGWSELNFMGRGFGVEVFGMSQRPASVDKDFMGSLSEIYVGRLPNPDDQKACARILGIDVAEVAALQGFEFIHRDMGQGGKITRIQ